ncbi:hypothetical protein MTR_5g076110 [Medicago truncatula]|uniref:Uncharacterized protein n=2 Tax=Medicago truncatula TaxID=3880 RepID=G7K5X7_MEDTR|nr:hypothetical protein MTR_5g076110 [Medicago truncatula]
MFYITGRTYYCHYDEQCDKDCPIPLKGWMNGNGGGKCYGVMVKAFSTVARNPYNGTKGACRHVNTLTLKSLMEQRKSV